ncbi:hypothetical protein FRC06_008709, partial [Ceratobasidium sp. 370]
DEVGDSDAEDEVSTVEVPTDAVSREVTVKSSVNDEVDDIDEMVDGATRVMVEDADEEVCEVGVASGTIVDDRDIEVVDASTHVDSKTDEDVASTMEEGWWDAEVAKVEDERDEVGAVVVGVVEVVVIGVVVVSSVVDEGRADDEFEVTATRVEVGVAVSDDRPVGDDASADILQDRKMVGSKDRAEN